jgi:hypothetical protein
MSTALAEAFKAAGWQKPNDRLLGIALEAWGKWPAATMAGARRDFVVQRISGEMTYALIVGWQANMIPQAVGWLLNQAREAIENEKNAAKAAGRGQRGGDTQVVVAPTNLSGGMPVGGGQVHVDTQRDDAPATPKDATPQAERQSEAAKETAASIPHPPPRSNLTVLAEKQAARAKTSAAVQIKLSRLDTVLIDGKPIGDCSVSEVRAWAARRDADRRAAGRDVQFALNLVANLPAGTVIREHWAPMLNDVDKMYDRAEAEHAA